MKVLKIKGITGGGGEINRRGPLKRVMKMDGWMYVCMYLSIFPRMMAR
jgi:hypothetical protein